MYYNSDNDINDNDIDNDNDNETESDTYSYPSLEADDINTSCIYEPEEQTLTKNNIVLCELYNDDILTSNHYLIYIRFKEFDKHQIDYYMTDHSLKLHIAECVYLPSGHCVGILKTFWISIIQRAWKKICKTRKTINNLRSNPSSVYYRELHGKWPDNCKDWPKLRGMLYHLSRTSS